MSKMQQDDERISDGVNLLISILVRYPEIGSINYDAKDNSIKLIFMLSSLPSKAFFDMVLKTLLSSISAYHTLEGLKNAKTDIKVSACEQVAMLTILRDVATLSKGEIALIITLLRENFKDQLLADDNETMLEEDLLVQEEVIDNMLENIKRQHFDNGLIGIREDGRVLVFNK
jgi:hypothetical protein